MNKKQSYGFSLVELLLAMVVGLIVISGVFSLHATSRKTQARSEAQMDMVADARFAIDLIAYDLRHAGMWGGTNKDSLIDCKSTDSACTATTTGDTPPSSMANDCDTGWYYNLSLPIFATNDSNPYGSSCIPTSEGYVDGTDILEIRYANSNEPAALLANQAYIRSNFINGRIFIGTVAPELEANDADPLTKNHELHAFAYYISDYTDSSGDGIPSLRRVSLVNAPSLQTQLLVSGVSNMQVQFGVDVDGDDQIDRYVDADAIASDEWADVYAAKIWLLMRSDKKQKGIDTTKSFSIAGAVAADFGGQDDYRYFLVTSVVQLRNLNQI